MKNSMISKGFRKLKSGASEYKNQWVYGGLKCKTNQDKPDGENIFENFRSEPPQSSSSGSSITSFFGPNARRAA